MVPDTLPAVAVARACTNELSLGPVKLKTTLRGRSLAVIYVGGLLLMTHALNACPFNGLPDTLFAGA